MKTISSNAGKRRERNAAQLYREISARGYPGGATIVRAYVAHLRSTTADGSAPRSRKERAKAVSPRALRWLLARKRDDLDQKEHARLEQLLLEGIESGPATPMTKADWEEIKQRGLERLAQQPTP